MRNYVASDTSKASRFNKLMPKFQYAVWTRWQYRMNVSFLLLVKCFTCLKLLISRAHCSFLHPPGIETLNYQLPLSTRTKLKMLVSLIVFFSLAGLVILWDFPWYSIEEYKQSGFVSWTFLIHRTTRIRYCGGEYNVQLLCRRIFSCRLSDTSNHRTCAMLRFTGMMSHFENNRTLNSFFLLSSLGNGHLRNYNVLRSRLPVSGYITSRNWTNMTYKRLKKPFRRRDVHNTRRTKNAASFWEFLK